MAEALILFEPPIMPGISADVNKTIKEVNKNTFEVCEVPIKDTPIQINESQQRTLKDILKPSSKDAKNHPLLQNQGKTTPEQIKQAKQAKKRGLQALNEGYELFKANGYKHNEASQNKLQEAFQALQEAVVLTGSNKDKELIPNMATIAHQLGNTQLAAELSTLYLAENPCSYEAHKIRADIGVLGEQQLLPIIEAKKAAKEIKEKVKAFKAEGTKLEDQQKLLEEITTLLEKLKTLAQQEPQDPTYQQTFGVRPSLILRECLKDLSDLTASSNISTIQEYHRTFSFQYHFSFGNRGQAMAMAHRIVEKTYQKLGAETQKNLKAKAREVKQAAGAALILSPLELANGKVEEIFRQAFDGIPVSPEFITAYSQIFIESEMATSVIKNLTALGNGSFFFGEAKRSELQRLKLNRHKLKQELAELEKTKNEAAVKTKSTEIEKTEKEIAVLELDFLRVTLSGESMARFQLFYATLYSSGAHANQLAYGVWDAYKTHFAEEQGHNDDYEDEEAHEARKLDLDILRNAHQLFTNGEATTLKAGLQKIAGQGLSDKSDPQRSKEAKERAKEFLDGEEEDFKLILDTLNYSTTPNPSSKLANDLLNTAKAFKQEFRDGEFDLDDPGENLTARHKLETAAALARLIAETSRDNDLAERAESELHAIQQDLNKFKENQAAPPQAIPSQS